MNQIRQLVQEIADCMGVKVEIAIHDDRLRPKKSEVERLWCDNSKLKRLTSWAPKHEGLEGFKRGLISTAQWFTQKQNLEKYKANICNY